MELSGVWRGAVADEHLRRSYHAPDFSDEGWDEIRVPGHWRSSTPFAGTDGPVLYRTRFEAEAPAPGRRAWLTFDGIFYQSDVWLDGSYVGDTEGYFFPHTFEVTGPAGERHEHVLAVEVTCGRPRDRRAKRAITGAFQDSDRLDPQWNPGGIWRPVRMWETGPVRVESLRVLCGEATPDRAVVRVRAVLDAATAVTACVRTRVAGMEHRSEQRLAAGANRVHWDVTVDEPQLWWPHALGPQALHDLTVDVLLPGETGVPGEPSDSRTVRTGLRQVRMADWVWTVNGERLFLKGSDQGPVRMDLAEATAADLEGDVVRAREAGLDLLRVHAHVSRPELYAAADRHGMLLWQDFPLQGGYARGIRKQAVHQAREMVNLLGHHPSIAVWCAHDEPPHPAGRGGASVPQDALGARAMALHQLPTWNKTVLDGSVRRSFDRADGTRPALAHSGVLPHPGPGGDAHLSFGWGHGDQRELPVWAGRFPRLVRFVGGFGAQAVPETDAFLGPDAWPDLDWDRLETTHGLQRDLFSRAGLAPDRFEGYAEWKRATQAYQAELVRHHVEHLRRLKYRPTGGFCHYAFADTHPAVSVCLLDHERVPKPAFAALRDACRPVIVVADRLPARSLPGEALALDVHVVSDRREEVRGARVTAELSWSGGDHRWAWEGDVPADDCVRVGTVQALVPDAPGPLALRLVLEAGRDSATNCYEGRITP